MKHVYATLAQWHALAVIPAIASGPERPNEGKPRSLNKGIHLLLDDHFIAHSSGVERKVISPRRSLSKAVVTGAVEHQNWQPFFTVLHDGVANVKKGRSACGTTPTSSMTLPMALSSASRPISIRRTAPRVQVANDAGPIPGFRFQDCDRSRPTHSTRR
jgi:hypothetical protein